MRSTNRRRGRPRKEPHGPDRGTPEAQRKRRELVGSGNPSLAAYPLGVLLARGQISQAQHDAGCRYAWLRGRALGSTTTRGMFKLIFPSGPIPDTTQAVQASVEYRWREASEALLQVSRLAKEAVDHVAVYQRLPRWLSTQSALAVRPARPADTRARRAPDRRSPRFGSTFSYRLTISGGSGGGSQRSQ